MLQQVLAAVALKPALVLEVLALVPLVLASIALPATFGSEISALLALVPAGTTQP